MPMPGAAWRLAHSDAMPVIEHPCGCWAGGVGGTRAVLRDLPGIEVERPSGRTDSTPKSMRSAGERNLRQCGANLLRDARVSLGPGAVIARGRDGRSPRQAVLAEATDTPPGGPRRHRSTSSAAADTGPRVRIARSLRRRLGAPGRRLRRSNCSSPAGRCRPAIRSGQPEDRRRHHPGWNLGGDPCRGRPDRDRRLGIHDDKVDEEARQSESATTGKNTVGYLLECIRFGGSTAARHIAVAR